jgi:Asp-tRNA(Asn)/Glu-tRNA(Gln) amidotransferase A subunit family amidase
MPVGVQVVGPIGEDDRLTALSQCIADTLM